VREGKTLGQPLAIRDQGHSGNHLVLNDGALLPTVRVDQIREVVEKGKLHSTFSSGDELVDAEAGSSRGLPPRSTPQRPLGVRAVAELAADGYPLWG
jgi:hypothetical protein